MWIPEGPNGSPEVQLGDVGYINANGAFIFLFNVDYLVKDEATGTTSMAKYLSEDACHYFSFETITDLIKTYADYLKSGLLQSRTITEKKFDGTVGGLVLHLLLLLA